MSADPRVIGRGYPSHPAVLAALLALEVGMGLGLAHHGVRFDGFMDVHRTRFGDSVPLGVAIADQVAAIVLPIGVMMALTRARCAVSANVADAVIAVVARLPLLVVGVAILWMPLPATIVAMSPEAAGLLQPALLFPAFISLACVVAGYTLLVVGIRRSTAARGHVLALQSLAVFFLAEIAGKLMLLALRSRS